jgi:hypothetical protein
MTFKKAVSGDERNAAFGLPEHLAHVKPGLDGSRGEQEAESGKDHRRRPNNAKDIPQETLAHRIKRTPKGD